MKTDEQTINKVIAAMVSAYPGRFEVVKGMPGIWLSLLSDLPADTVYGAATQLVAVSKWPPSIADVRRLAVNLEKGRLSAPNAFEAWERVQRKSAGDDIELTDNEKRALKVIGGMHTVKTSTAISFDRKSFCDAFDSFEQTELREAIALSEVKRLATHNAPPATALPPAPERPDGRLTIPEHRASDPETVSSLLDGLPGYREHFVEGVEESN